MPRERKGLTPRKSQYKNPETFFVIATEGETEVKYFNELKAKRKGSTIKIEVLERESTSSAPDDVIKQLDEYVKEYVLEEGDEIWMVIDRDSQSWSVKQLKEIAKKCHQKKYAFGLSNPCFEIWLLLHIADIEEWSDEEKKKLFDNKKINKSRTFVEHKLIELFGEYNKSNPKLEPFFPNTNVAIERAKRLDLNPNARWMNNLGTRIYLLIEKII